MKEIMIKIMSRKKKILYSENIQSNEIISEKKNILILYTDTYGNV